MPGEIPKKELLDSIGSLPRQEIPVEFDEGERREIKITDAELRKTDLGEVAGWLNIYNRQFHFGTLAAKTVMRGWKDESSISDGGETEKEKELSFDEIQRRNQVVLSRTGLSLEPVRAIGVIMSQEGTEFPSELRINLSDGRQFVRYLESLKGDSLSQSQTFGLERTADSLTAQLKGQYDLANADDERLLELFGHASRIISEYERLDKERGKGLGHCIAELRELVSISKQGYLREHLRVVQEQLLVEIGGKHFGPSRWHTDITEEGYIKRWNKALTTLSEIAQNPKAKEFAERVRGHLLASLEYAEKDMKKRKDMLLNNKISAFIEATKQKLQA